MALTNVAINAAKAQDKPYKLADSGGLYLKIDKTGGKYWRLKYRFLGKEKTLALGVYPTISLAEAREKREAAKKELLNGTDPSLAKKTRKSEARKEAANTFKSIALEWHQKQQVKWSAKNAQRTLSLFEHHIFPVIGAMPITQILASDLLKAIQKIEARGNHETAHRAMMNCGQVFRYAIATARATTDLSLVLKGALIPVQVKHHASITDPEGVKKLMRDIHGYEGLYLTKQALKLAPLLFVRPGELRNAEWDEIDLEKAEWRIPAHKMKMNAVHIVPLSDQALAIFKELDEQRGQSKYVFPSITSIKRPMSENTLNMAIRRMGYDREMMTSHGFRSMASTMLHEQGWPHEAIERQLAHSDRDKVSSAYNYAQHLPKRKEMMQSWANYLDGLRLGAKVINLSHRAA